MASRSDSADSAIGSRVCTAAVATTLPEPLDGTLLHLRVTAVPEVVRKGTALRVEGDVVGDAGEDFNPMTETEDRHTLRWIDAIETIDVLQVMTELIR